jgi:hypothetical protein
MKEEKKHYSFVEIPTTRWISSDGSKVLSSNNGSWSQDDISEATNLVYNLGG